MLRDDPTKQRPSAIRATRPTRWLACFLILTVGLTGCLQTAPPDLVQDVEAIDRELHEVGGAEFAPAEYNAFVEQWVALKSRLEEDDDLIRLPWEPNRVAAEVARVAEQARKTLSLTKERREAQRKAADDQVKLATQRLSTLKQHVEELGGRAVVGQQVVETELLLHQAKTFYDHARYGRAKEQARLALKAIGAQTVKLTRELGRYADGEKIDAWQQMARHTVDWSRRARAHAIIVNKANRELKLYRSGKLLATHPILLGADGILEKHAYGDGATPEGYYHVVRKRGPRQTQFHRALILDYPNGEDRRSFHIDRATKVPIAQEGLPTTIAIHGMDERQLALGSSGVILDNRRMERLFQRIEPGTPVTIVGALEPDNPVSRVLPELAEFAAD